MTTPIAVLQKPFKASGTTLAYLLDGTTPTLVGQLKDIDTGGTQIPEIDVSGLASTCDVSIPSVPNNGDVTFTVYYVPGDTTVAELELMAKAPPIIPWQIQLPDGTGPTTGTLITFTAWLMGFTRKGFAKGSTPTGEVKLRVITNVTTTLGS